MYLGIQIIEQSHELQLPKATNLPNENRSKLMKR